MTTPLKPFKKSGFTANRGVRELVSAIGRLAAGVRASCEECTANGLKLYMKQSLRHLDHAQKDFLKAAAVSEQVDRENAREAALCVRQIMDRLESSMNLPDNQQRHALVRLAIENARLLDLVRSELSGDAPSENLQRVYDVALHSTTWQDVVDAIRNR